MKKLLLPLAAIFAIGAAAALCPERCQCTETEVDCRNRGLDRVPKDMPRGNRDIVKM